MYLTHAQSSKYFNIREAVHVKIQAGNQYLIKSEGLATVDVITFVNGMKKKLHYTTFYMLLTCYTTLFPFQKRGGKDII